MKFGEVRKSLMIFCLMASVALHVGALFLVYRHPPTMKQPDALALMKPAPHLAAKDEEEKLVEQMEKALEESLNAVVTAPHYIKLPEDLASEDLIEEESLDIEETPFEKTLFASTPKMRQEELSKVSTVQAEFSASMPTPFDPELEASLTDFALEDELEENIVAYDSEKYASVDFSDQPLLQEPVAAQIVEDDYTMTDEQFSPSALPTHLDGLTPQFVASLRRLKAPAAESDGIHNDQMFTNLQESTSPKLILPNSVDYLRSQWLKRSLAERGSLPDFSHYGLEELTTNLEWERDLDIEVTLMPDPNSNKYIFSLTIQPEFTNTCESMNQNFYFVIDRSQSIEKHKFSRFKRAVQRSLAALHEGDSFNIYLFDKKVVKLSEKTLAVTPKTIQMAEAFLERQTSKASSKEPEIYTSLEAMLPDHFDPNQLHSVILISDGTNLLGAQQKRRAISTLPERFDADVNIYTAAAGKGNNLVLLDLLSYTTAGKMLYSDTNAGFPRKMVRLVKDLHQPVMKSLSIDISPSSANAQVNVYPRNQLLPPMFADQPYVITGTVDELCNLDLVIQGQNRDRWINVHKKLSLKGAVRTSRSLEKAWANTQARQCYDHFLKNGKNYHLTEAKQIVAPHRGAIASDQ